MDSSAGRDAYSTLEVNTHAQNLNSYPEVPPADAPEAVHVYPEVNHNGPVPFGDGEVEKDGSKGSHVPVAAPMVCGLRRNIFWIVLVVVSLVVIGIVVGVAVGVTASRLSSGADAETQSTETADGGQVTLLRNTKIAAANFTDEAGNENYLVVYQMSNKAIYMSTWNSSHNQWVVSPVVDGSNGISLDDDVKEGTPLALDIYRQNTTSRNVHVYWLSPNSLIKSNFKTTISTNAPSPIGEWWVPPSSDKSVAAAGSSIVSYGKQCDDCTPWTYHFWQAEDGTFGGSKLSLPQVGVWKGIPFDRTAYAPPATNTSLSLTSIPATNGTTPTVGIFYRSATGTLTNMWFDGDAMFLGKNLPRDVSAGTSIVAFTTGSNVTDGADPRRWGGQVLTVDPGLRDGVQLTYRRDGVWTKDSDPVEDLAACEDLGSMAATRARRVYCVVEDGQDVEIVEWAWQGDPQDTGTYNYKSYERIGVVSTVW